jgi:hypothetical protein
MAPIRNSLIDGCYEQGSYWKGFLLVKLKKSLGKFYGRHHDLVDRYGICCVTNGHVYVPLVVNTSLSFPHSWLLTGLIVTRLTRATSGAGTSYAFRITWVHPRFSVGFVLLDHWFYVYALYIVVCPFSFDHCVVFVFDLWILITLLVSSNSS